MDWQDHSRAPQRIFSRRASIATIANEQAVVEKAASTVRRVTKRGVRNLETALKALSTPFVPIPSRANGSMPPQSNREGRSLSRESLRSNCSDVTMPSTLDFTPDVISSAEEIVLNARRKQAILLSIIVKLQRNCRIYLIKKGRLRRLRKSCVVVQNDPLSAAIHIQMQLRRYLAQRRFQQIRAASISIVACRRGAIIRVAFLSLLARLTHVQASYRGHLLRQQLSNVFTLRMMKYKKCLFPLWYRACTPLTYRCQFWSLMNTARCIRLAVSEQELSRLWTELRIKVPLPGIGDIPYDEESRIAAHLGITSTTCWQAQKVIFCMCTIFAMDSNDVASDYTFSLQIEYLLAAERTPIKSRRNSKAVDMLADRVLAERTQIYERLSITSIGSLERLNTYFLRFAIPLKEKKKKAALTESLCTFFTIYCFIGSQLLTSNPKL